MGFSRFHLIKEMALHFIIVIISQIVSWLCDGIKFAISSAKLGLRIFLLFAVFCNFYNRWTTTTTQLKMQFRVVCLINIRRVKYMYTNISANMYVVAIFALNKHAKHFYLERAVAPNNTFAIHKPEVIVTPCLWKFKGTSYNLLWLANEFDLSCNSHGWIGLLRCF